jgi:hypothetical protein
MEKIILVSLITIAILFANTPVKADEPADPSPTKQMFAAIEKHCWKDATNFMCRDRAAMVIATSCLFDYKDMAEQAACIVVRYRGLSAEEKAALNQGDD